MPPTSGNCKEVPFREDMIVDYLIDNELSNLDKQIKISIRKKDNNFVCYNESLALS